MQKLPFALIGVAVIILGVFLYLDYQQEPGTELQSYESTEYALSFSYPKGYVASEVSSDAAVTLMRETEMPVPENGEGPTGITIYIYERTDASLAEWAHNESASNLSRGDGTYASTTVDGAEAITYSWSGLYEGETTAVARAHSIVTISVTRLSPDDHTEAYETVLQTIDLQ